MYKTVSRDRLFFDRYKFCMRFRFDQSGRMRSLLHEDIRKSCVWTNHAANITSSWISPVSAEHYNVMLQLSDLINSVTVEFKRIVFTEWQNFYTNDPEFFSQLAAVPGVRYITYHEAVVNQPRDTVVLEHSDYQWRSYFHERWYSQDQMNILSNFITSRPQQFFITKNWRNRLSNCHCWITRMFFVDHYDPQDVMLLNMVLPGCVRKTMPIVKKC
jgi:hypothetical protein